MRIAMDARFLSSPILRGMDRYLVGLTSELTRRGVEVTLLHRQREALHLQHLEGSPATATPLADRSGVWWEQISVPRALKRGRFDLYHAPAERGVPFIAPCPVVLTYHSTTTESYRDLVARGLLSGSASDYLGYAPPVRRTVRQFYEWEQQYRANHVLTPSEFSRSELVRLNGLSAERVTVTPLAAAERFNSERKSADEISAVLNRLHVVRPFILYVGGYEPHKNVTGLLEMFAEVRKARPDLQLVCVGSRTPPLTIEQRVLSPDLVGAVRLLSSLDAELTALYDAAELFVTLSWRETFCLPALEAMTRGTPVVASAWGAAPELIDDQSLLVDPRDTTRAAAVIRELLASRQRLESLGARAMARASRYSWSRTADVTLDVYRRVIDERRRQTT